MIGTETSPFSPLFSAATNLPRYDFTTESLKSGQEEFKRLMLTVGWSAAETSRRLKISRSAVSQILKGKNQPRATTLELLRSKTNV